MKLSKGLFLAFAGLGLFACSNEDVSTEVDNSANNSIVIKLDGLTTSRAIGDATAGNNDQTVTTTLNDVAIVLSDGSTIYGVNTLTNSDSEWTQLTTTASGYIIHQVSSHVREVHVIGNYAENQVLKSWVESTQTTPSSSTVSAMKALVVKANTQQDFTNVTLFGEDVALTSVAEPHDGHTSTTLEANVELKHLVSRIEIGNIQCTNLGTTYSELTLKYIGLLNYYNQIHLDGTIPEVSMTLDNVLEPTVTNNNPGEGKYSWSNEATDALYSWAWNKIADNTKLTNTTAWNPGTDQKFVYQFIPNQIAGKNFNVKLYLDATEKTGGATSAFHTVTANFGAQIDGTAGKIYKVNFAFAEDNIGSWNPSEDICVKVKVTVQNWTIKVVTPTFE